jgi:hypothetical protein
MMFLHEPPVGAHGCFMHSVWAGNDALAAALMI